MNKQELIQYLSHEIEVTESGGGASTHMSEVFRRHDLFVNLRALLDRDLNDYFNYQDLNSFLNNILAESMKIGSVDEGALQQEDILNHIREFLNKLDEPKPGAVSPTAVGDGSTSPGIRIPRSPLQSPTKGLQVAASMPASYFGSRVRLRDESSRPRQNSSPVSGLNGLSNGDDHSDIDDEPMSDYDELAELDFEF